MAADALLTGALLFFVLGATSAGAWQQHVDRRLDWLGYAWLVAAVLPLVLRRRLPMTVSAISGILAFTYYQTGYPGGPVMVAAVVALYTVARWYGPLRAAIMGGALLVVSSALGWIISGSLSLEGLTPGTAGVVAAIGVGAAVRSRAAAARAARQESEEHSRRLAEEKRLRIAREVHDVVAHSLAMINVQAGVAAHVADRRPEQAKEALLAIKEASRSALADLRATLAVLRSGEEDRAPAPSLERLAELVEATSGTGLRVDVIGEPGELPAPVDSAAYRIVQESMTNAVRHAANATTLTVRFARDDGRLEVLVRDDGSGSVDPGSGNGLRGMRERAAALGGTVTAGPVPEGGFQVLAVLPVQATDV